MKKLTPLFWILVLAFALRLIPLNQSLWLDEAINVTNARDRGVLDLITNYALADFHPPLYHPVLHYWIKLTSDLEFAVRLPSLIFGLITIYFTHQISRLIIPSKKLTINHLKFDQNLLPVLFLATSGLHVYYSTEARMYSMAAAFASITIYLFLTIIKTHSLKPNLTSNLLKSLTITPLAIYFVISLTLMLYTDYLTWLLLPLFFFYLPVHTLTSLIFTLPWLPYFYQQLNIGLQTASANPLWSQVVGQFSPKSVVLLPVKFLIGRVSIDNQTHYALALILPLLLITYLFSTAIKNTRASKSDSNLIFTWFFLPTLTAAIISIKISIFSYFRFIFVLPAFYLIITLGISKLKPHFKELIITFLLFINLTTTIAFIFIPKFHREDWRSLSDWIDSYPTTNAVTVFPNLSQQAPYLYYQPNIKAVDSIRQVSDLPDVVFLMRYVQDIFDPTDSKRLDIEALRYQLIEQRDFNGVVVWAYTRSDRVLARKL